MSTSSERPLVNVDQSMFLVKPAELVFSRSGVLILQYIEGATTWINKIAKSGRNAFLCIANSPYAGGAGSNISKKYF